MSPEEEVLLTKIQRLREEGRDTEVAILLREIELGMPLDPHVQQEQVDGHSVIRANEAAFRTEALWSDVVRSRQITTDMIQAGNINADHIQVSPLGVDLIQDGTITGGTTPARGFHPGGVT